MSELLPFAAKVAEAKRLRCDDGTWLCWACHGAYAPLHVSLHCPGCRRGSPQQPAPRAPQRAGTRASYSVVDDDPAEEWDRG